MKTLVLLLVMAASAACPICIAGEGPEIPGSIDARPGDLYRGEYTLDKAEKYIGNREYDKAAWVCINLFRKYPGDAISGLESLKGHVDDVVLMIKVAFVRYSMEDPETTTVEDGHFKLDSQKYEEKGRWAAELIDILSKKQVNKDMLDFGICFSRRRGMT